MANIGIGNASYYADNSISRLNRQVGESVEKVSSNKSNVTNGDKSSLVSMDNTFKLDLAATNAAVKNIAVIPEYSFIEELFMYHSMINIQSSPKII